MSTYQRQVGGKEDKGRTAEPKRGWGETHWDRCCPGIPSGATGQADIGHPSNLLNKKLPSTYCAPSILLVSGDRDEKTQSLV